MVNKEIMVFNIELNDNSSEVLIKLASEKIQKSLRDNMLEEKFLTNERLKLMQYLLDTKSWKVSQVAKEFGLTRQRVYKILSKEDK